METVAGLAGSDKGHVIGVNRQTLDGCSRVSSAWHLFCLGYPAARSEATDAEQAV
jgi:hypothetical protein